MNNNRNIIAIEKQAKKNYQQNEQTRQKKWTKHNQTNGLFEEKYKMH